MSEIQTTTPNHVKVKMRKMKVVPACIKAEVYKGAKCLEATVQFNSDVNVYNLYEAIIYVEDYEKSGHYAEGTAMRAMDAYFKTPAVKKILQEAMP